MKRTIIVFLSLFAAVVLLVASVSLYNDWQLSKKYGERRNPFRIKKGLPLVEESMKLKTYDDRVVFKYFDTDSTKGPYHLKKIILIKDDSAISENDIYYHYEDQEIYHLVDIEYRLNTWIWKCSFLTGYLGNGYLNTVKDGISIDEADSILHTWGLSRTAENEFSK